jgi:hypothetical protein
MRVIQERSIVQRPVKCGPRLTYFFRNEIDNVLRQNKSRNGKGLLVFATVTEKTWVLGGVEHSRASGVSYSAPPSFREEIHWETSIEEQADPRIIKSRHLNRVHAGRPLSDAQMK